MYSGMQAIVQAQHRRAAQTRLSFAANFDEAFRMEMFELLAPLLVERVWVNADELTLLHASNIDGSLGTREVK